MEEILKEAQQKMEKALEHMKHEFGKVRTGRANPQILEGVMVDYYGTPTSIMQVGNVSVPDSQMIVITPWEKKMLSEIEKAILRADLGMTPQNDGNVVRLPVPPLTEDRRKEMVKQIKKIAEDAKVGIRSVRRDSNERLKKKEKDKVLSQDDVKTGEARIQKLTDEKVVQVDKLTGQKESELMAV
ncbi:MAG: ribosome recycling factor [Candidatus Lambdaproteobacteria bacterium RIFOXYD1_FULL_56_27]|uniref:Ribosome-recycling factor n=1 Tax=Candidatus Lambdaproteobacteria bacterium RIFOXYD2_FULL_56_26 TaxID=1817773 RepID=A0A1F6H325_9PROT|nr:MAG: ribosome recycling factor [Candidatus Lambdaproteobacteria bacterium RIFOXYD2_FULL_56_26]OGH05412.1 MAG: ribosome recycling factor [Candidatus Lambdaproteobacteria bacterium RIFOXYC1_FULL_56_13]OGH09256.1 MAG: ribosome recycling factor [Candidatus Lambdaproteobacteria bacterium RIFOXYD1_FULL_56_27]